MILITNVTDKAVDVTKGVRVGSIESLDDASNTRYWEKATNDVEVYFGAREDSKQSVEVVEDPSIESSIEQQSNFAVNVWTGIKEKFTGKTASKSGNESV